MHSFSFSHVASFFFFFFGREEKDWWNGEKRADQGCAIWAMGIGRNAKAKCSNCSQTYGGEKVA